MLLRIYEDLGKLLKPNEVLIIYGPRRVGKTILLENYLSKTNLKFKLENGGDLGVQEVFTSQRVESLRRYAQGYDLIAIDEAQYIPNIGNALKLLVDSVPGIKVIATGSASFDLSNKVGEPLTGRNTTLILYPVFAALIKEQFN